MNNQQVLIGPLLQGFFIEHLLQHKHVSAQTISSYRDTFRILLQFLHKKCGTTPAAMKITDLDAPEIISFLDYLEDERQNSIRSRNARLAAIRTFFRWVTLCNPEHVGLAGC